MLLRRFIEKVENQKKKKIDFENEKKEEEMIENNPIYNKHINRDYDIILLILKLNVVEDEYFRNFLLKEVNRVKKQLLLVIMQDNQLEKSKKFLIKQYLDIVLEKEKIYANLFTMKNLENIERNLTKLKNVFWKEKLLLDDYLKILNINYLDIIKDEEIQKHFTFASIIYAFVNSSTKRKIYINEHIGNSEKIRKNFNTDYILLELINSEINKER